MPVSTAPVYAGLGQVGLNPARVVVVDAHFAPVNTLYSAPTGVNGGWLPLGRLQPGSVKNEFSRKYYDVMSGLPETAKESFVTGVDGKLMMNLMEVTAKGYELANGGDFGVPIFQTTPVATTVSAAPAPAQDVFGVTSATGLSVGQQIQVTLATGIEYTTIIAISGSALTVFPKLSAVPASPNPVKLVDGWEEPVGGATINYYAFRTVTSEASGKQIITWSPKVRFNGIKDEMPQGKEMVLPLDLFCYGFTDPNYTGSIVAKKFTLNPSVAVAFSS